MILEEGRLEVIIYTIASVLVFMISFVMDIVRGNWCNHYKIGRWKFIRS